MRAKKILYSFLLILFKTNFLAVYFSVFGVDFDVFSAFFNLHEEKKACCLPERFPQPLSEAVQGGEDQARGESWLFPY